MPRALKSLYVNASYIQSIFHVCKRNSRLYHPITKRASHFENLMRYGDAIGNGFPPMKNKCVTHFFPIKYKSIAHPITNRASCFESYFENIMRVLHREKYSLTLFSRFKPNLDCNYTLPIDLATSGIQFGAKSIGSV